MKIVQKSDVTYFLIAESPYALVVQKLLLLFVIFWQAKATNLSFNSAQPHIKKIHGKSKPTYNQQNL